MEYSTIQANALELPTGYRDLRHYSKSNKIAIDDAVFRLFRRKVKLCNLIFLKFY